MSELEQLAELAEFRRHYRDTMEPQRNERPSMTLRQRWRKTSLPNKMSILIALFVAATTGLSVAIAYWQYALSVRSDKSNSAQTDRLIDASTAMVEALKAANATQLDALDKSAEQSRQTIEAAGRTARAQIASQQGALRLERRAWVGVVGVRDVTVTPGSPVSLMLRIQNSGASPALNLIPQFGIRVKVNDEKFDPNAETLSPLPPTRGTALMPNSETLSRLATGGPTLTAEALEAMKMGLLRVYVIGRITYQDIFGQPHTTNYCAQLDPAMPAIIACAERNNAD